MKHLQAIPELHIIADASLIYVCILIILGGTWQYYILNLFPLMINELEPCFNLQQTFGYLHSSRAQALSPIFHLIFPFFSYCFIEFTYILQLCSLSFHCLNVFSMKIVHILYRKYINLHFFLYDSCFCVLWNVCSPTPSSSKFIFIFPQFLSGIDYCV